VATRDPLHPLHARQPGGREPTTGGAALGELLNSAVRPPSPELPKTPSLLSSREGQSQLRTAIRSNLQRVMDLFRELDEDGDGEIDRNEFRKGMQILMGKSYPMDELDELFDSIDTSCDGTISYRELYRTVRSPTFLRAASASCTRPALCATQRMATAGRGGRVLEAAGDASGYLEAMSADGGTKPFLHPLREKEVLRLFHEFKSQHADGVCRVPRFDRLLRLKFPTESKEMISAMMSACISREQSRAQAAAEKTAHSKLVEQIFETLDEDGSGTISINEFLQLSKTIGLPKSKLRAIFAARDTDGSGALDMREFCELVEECKLLENREAIEQAAEERTLVQKSKQELWRIGLPAEALKPRPPLAERPSLANVSSSLLSMRRAIQVVRTDV